MNRTDIMHTIKRYIAALIVTLALIVPASASASPLTQFGAKCVNHPILTFPSWYKNLECETVTVQDGKGGETKKQQPELTSLNDIWIIALNLVEALVGAAAYVAVGYIIWGGFRYMKSRGDPGKVTEAKLTITYAVLGLGVALASTAIVIFVGSLF